MFPSRVACIESDREVDTLWEIRICKSLLWKLVEVLFTFYEIYA